MVSLDYQVIKEVDEMGEKGVEYMEICPYEKQVMQILFSMLIVVLDVWNPPPFLYMNISLRRRTEWEILSLALRRPVLFVLSSETNIYGIWTTCCCTPVQCLVLLQSGMLD